MKTVEQYAEEIGRFPLAKRADAVLVLIEIALEVEADEDQRDAVRRIMAGRKLLDQQTMDLLAKELERMSRPADT